MAATNVYDNTSTFPPDEAEQNRAAGSDTDDDANWWVPIIIVILILAILFAMVLIWRQREKANANVMASLKSSRQISVTHPNDAFNPDITAVAPSSSTLAALEPIDNPTYGVADTGGNGYLDVCNNGADPVATVEYDNADDVYYSATYDGAGISTSTYQEVTDTAVGFTDAEYTTASVSSVYDTVSTGAYNEDILHSSA